MLASLVLGSLLASSIERITCPLAVRIEGDDTSAIQQLGESLSRSGIETGGALSSRCAVFHVDLVGFAPPYTLSLSGPGARSQTWHIHLVDLGAAMIEAAIGQLPPPMIVAHREEPEVPMQLAIAVSAEVGGDGSGNGYAGPGVRASYCFGMPCLGVVGHFGMSPRGTYEHQDASLVFGPSLRGSGEDWSASLGVGGGVRWTRVVANPVLVGTVPIDAWPFATAVANSVAGAFELDVGLARRIDARWSIEALASVALMPEGGNDVFVANLAGSAAVSARFGVGLRWSPAP